VVYWIHRPHSGSFTFMIQKLTFYEYHVKISISLLGQLYYIVNSYWVCGELKNHIFSI
jgi:hypothetical protein